MRDLTAKRVLITGAGHGVGRELALQFALQGATIIVTDLDLVRVESTVEFLTNAGHKAVGFRMDVSDPASVKAVRNQVRESVGSIDILVNNAGVVFGGAFMDVPIEKHLATYRVNTMGPAIVTHAFLPDLVENDEGHCVNIASAAAMIALPNAATYASSKWAVLGFSESLREELRLNGHEHVGVTAVCPSYVGTGMFAGVCTPRFTPMLTPKKLANQIINSVRKNKEQLLTPWLVKLIPFGRGTMHRSLFRWLCNWLRVTTSMITWNSKPPQPKVEVPAARVPTLPPQKRTRKTAAMAVDESYP
ncbi:SDR family oxidoreductase [Symmachiella dynata]|uniref:Oxidoreductase SadH n=1 Tax=Symmachiella dynata TaxID=2527995 RepID=A0A517ZX28_9PLAN|nr:SDR family oxidoreductase [Symmachiella dynata]QDT51293.1 Putative oxidoreductase SadH [Symmachiella dynata]QDU46996.1 Putative oxidoreductase SadH [Symmachiella dynata]